MMLGESLCQTFQMCWMGLSQGFVWLSPVLLYQNYSLEMALCMLAL